MQAGGSLIGRRRPGELEDARGGELRATLARDQLSQALGIDRSLLVEADGHLIAAALDGADAHPPAEQPERGIFDEPRDGRGRGVVSRGVRGMGEIYGRLTAEHKHS